MRDKFPELADEFEALNSQVEQFSRSLTMLGAQASDSMIQRAGADATVLESILPDAVQKVRLQQQRKETQS